MLHNLISRDFEIMFALLIIGLCHKCDPVLISVYVIWNHIIPDNNSLIRDSWQELLTFTVNLTTDIALISFRENN